MNAAAQRDDRAAAACIADVCAALQAEERAEERAALAARAAAGARLLDARLAEIQASLDRIEARLGAVERELVTLTRPNSSF